MRELLAAGLPSVKTANQKFVEASTLEGVMAAQAALPQTGRIRDRIIQLLDEYPLLDFFADQLRLELADRFEYLRDKHPLLCELPGYEDRNAVADRFIADFESLPWQYRISVHLPKALDSLLPPTAEALELAPFLRIIRLTDSFKEEFPLSTDSKGRNERLRRGGFLFMDEEPAWDGDGLCVQAAAEGYIGPYGGSVAAHSAERHIRAFLGMGLATGFIKSGHLPYPAVPAAFAYVHRHMPDGTWQPITRYDLNDSISKGLARLRINDLDGKLKPEHYAAWAGHGLQHIAAAYSAGRRAEQVLSAAPWHFDSHAGIDSLLAYVQSMVVLEIIFGEKAISDEVGIGELIASRFAYLVGTTHDERESFMREFRKIYQVRSQIVHAGKPRLGFEDRRLFGYLQWMGGRAIDKEIELLKAAVEKEKAANMAAQTRMLAEALTKAPKPSS